MGKLASTKCFQRHTFEYYPLKRRHKRFMLKICRGGLLIHIQANPFYCFCAISVLHLETS